MDVRPLSATPAPGPVWVWVEWTYTAPSSTPAAAEMRRRRPPLKETPSIPRRSAAMRTAVFFPSDTARAFASRLSRTPLASRCSKYPARGVPSGGVMSTFANPALKPPFISALRLFSRTQARQDAQTALSALPLQADARWGHGSRRSRGRCTSLCSCATSRSALR